jgi:L,D-transpeptidase ErfK/SrfK
MINYDNLNCPVGSVPYTIRGGDTLEQIAKLYGANVSDILHVNPNIDPINLSVGKQICIPIQFQYYPNCPTTNYYVVKPTDSFESISAYFNLNPIQMLYANYGIDPDDLYEDQVLCIPIVPSPVNVIIRKEDAVVSVVNQNEIVTQYPILNPETLSFYNKDSYIILFKLVDPGSESGARYLGFSKSGLGIQSEHYNLLTDDYSGTSIILRDESIQELFNLVTVGATVTIM